MSSIQEIRDRLYTIQDAVESISSLLGAMEAEQAPAPSMQQTSDTVANPDVQQQGGVKKARKPRKAPTAASKAAPKKKK